MVGEAVQGTADPVGDLVAVLPGDRAVRIADLDYEVVALLVGRVLVGRSRRASHRHDVDRVHAVVPVLPRIRRADGDLPEDPVLRRRREVVVDRLADEERAGGLDRDVTVVRSDLLEPRLGGSGATGEDDDAQTGEGADGTRGKCPTHGR